MSFLRRAGSPLATLLAAGLLALTASAPGFATELAETVAAPSVLATAAAVDATIPQTTPRPAVVFAAPSPVVQPLPSGDAENDAEAEQRYASLADAVAAQDAGDADGELSCLAAGVYFEANGEPLAGQLAVAETILNRARSGRFPPSVCAVLTQAGQFSFVRGGRIPSAVGRAGWKTALAIAKVAQRNLWDDVAPKALFFHATHVSPNWRAARIAKIGNHIFYR